jgi:hypothetical protein
MAVWADTTLNMKKAELIRKALDAIVTIAPIASTVPETIVDATGASPVIPTGYEPLGWHSEDGLTWGREVENSDITSHGAVDPTRSDIRRITSTLGVTCQETNLQTIAAHLGIDLSSEQPPSSGEVVIDEPARPKSRHYRLLAISVDDSDAGEIYIGRLFARAKITETGEQTWSDGDEAMVRPMTFTAYQDSALGLSVRHFFGGPGWKALLTDMGFPAAAV